MQNRYFGLTDQQVLESRAKNGANVLTPPEKDPLWKLFLRKFGDPLIIILLVAGILSVGISCYEYWGLNEGGEVFFEPVGIFVAILLATGLSFYFEHKADKEFSILNQVNDDELIEVIRNGNTTQVPKRDIVVGDVVVINTGAEVPADGVLLEATDLIVDESSLTGEPLCSKTTTEADFNPDATFPCNHVMRGTKVMEGHCIMEVLAVGDNTENGKVYEASQIDDNVKTPLNEQLNALSMVITDLSYSIAALIIVGKLFVYFNSAWQTWFLLIPTALFFGYVIKHSSGNDKSGKSGKKESLKWISIIVGYLVVFIAGVLLLHHWLMPEQELSRLLAYTLETLMVAVTLIVVAVPEGLPMTVTLSLAYSMRRMLKTNNLVRKMHACETMGATTVICTDKTGTLTQNQMRVYDAQFYDKSLMPLVEAGIAVNSTASLARKDDMPRVLGNPTEGALLLWLFDNGKDFLELKAAAPVVEELPFSTERKYMATVVTSAVTGRRMLYVKGAPEIVCAMCRNNAGNVSCEDINKQMLAYQEQAMRTLGFAFQELTDGETAIKDHKVVATGLTFMGVVAISDPVREDVPPAIKECINAGISVKIVTGDTPGTARQIARQIGLLKPEDGDDCIITGPEFAALSDTELLERVKGLKIIARARPMDKKRLVEALHALNEGVAGTGDGTNDAPALKAAHVGLSMGDGTAVAKEASDITIIDNSFSSIGRAVMWGRSLYQNIQRFLLFQLTVNVSACFIVLAGAFMGTESPLTVTQMLWVNLIMDTFGAMALASLPPTERVMKEKPRDRKAFILTGDMLTNILGVGIVFFLMLLGLLYVFQHAEVNSMADFTHLQMGRYHAMTPYEQTLLFSIFVWTHFWYMFNARTFFTGRSVFSAKMSSGFWTIVTVIVMGQLLITEAGYKFFNVEPMLHNAAHPSGLTDFLVIVLGSSIVLWMREGWSLAKRLTYRKAL